MKNKLFLLCFFFSFLLLFPVANISAQVWVSLGDPISAAQANYINAGIDTDGSTFVVSYQDTSIMSRATVKSFDFGTFTWSSVGFSAMSNANATYITQALDSVNGVLAVAYEDGIWSKGVARAFDGNSWEYLGNYFSSGETKYTSIATDGAGGIAVAYQDLVNSKKATVKAYVPGSDSWVSIGDPVSTGEASDISLKLVAPGVPFIVYKDVANGGKGTSFLYSGDPASWMEFGPFSSGEANYISLAVDMNNGIIAVAYQDVVNDKKVTVKILNMETYLWEDFGTPDFSVGEAKYISLALDSSGLPWVAYQDVTADNKAVVKAWDGVNWVDPWPAVSTGEANYINLILLGDIPAIFYQDVDNSSKAIFKIMIDTPVVSSYVGSFTEAVTNDGSVTGSRVMTVGNDTFELDHAGGTLIEGVDYELANVPAGLTPSMTVSGDATTATLTFSGNAVNHSDIIDDVSDLTITFLDGAFENTPTASDVTFYTNNTGVIDFFTPSVSYTRRFSEASVNDGSVEGDRIATVTNDTFVNAGGTLTEGLHYTLTNKPDGLVASMAVSGDGTTATLTFSGNAISHLASDSVSDLTITFLDGAFTNTPLAASVENNFDNTGEIEFFSSVEVVYGGSFTESGTNDGSVTGSRYAQVSYDSFVNAGGTLTEGLHYTLTNKPDGLVASMAVSGDGTTATLTFSGNATNHSNSDDVSDLTITFLDGAFEATVPASNVSGYTDNTGVVDFFTAYWENVGNPGFSEDYVNYTDLAINQKGTPYIAFMDGNASNKLSVMKFNGTAWEYVGEPGLSVDLAAQISIVLDSNDVPYVSFTDQGDGNKLFVMKFNGVAWENVGLAVSMPGMGMGQLLLYDDVPYVAYRDESSGWKILVRRYVDNPPTGFSWVAVTPNLVDPDNTAWEVDFSLDSNGVPYVVYKRNTGMTSIKRFNDSVLGDWEYVGDANFSTSATYLSIDIGSDNVPYVAYQDFNDNFRLVVKKFNGISWENVGETISESTVWYPKLVLDSNNIPYVSYDESANLGKATVKKFNGTSWEYVGNPGFSSSQVAYMSLTLNSDNVPYVSYQDFSEGSGKATVMRLITPPKQISNLVATPSKKQVTLSWTIQNDGGVAPTDHLIEYKKSSSGVWTIFPHTPLTTNSIVVTGLLNNTSYDFRVSSSNEDGMYSDPVTNTANTIRFSSTSGSYASGSYTAGVMLPSTNTSTTGMTPSSNNSKFIFTKNLKYLMLDNEVKELQKFLNTHGYPVSLTGAGSSGLETTKFGSLTQKALIKFQKANNITPAVGYFGPITRAKVNSLN
jgi:hypothetical protein